MTINQIEDRFKLITELDMNLEKYPIRKKDYQDQQQKTTKEQSDKFGFVTTPIYLVDIMIALKYNEFNPSLKTCDLCAGYGQFTVRLMRMLYNRFNMDIDRWLKYSHTLTELQPESCACLVYIFGPDINLYCGDSMNLKYSEDSDLGIMVFDKLNKKWNNPGFYREIQENKDNLENLKQIFNKHLSD